MKDNNHKLPNRIKMGQTNRRPAPSPPTVGGGQGRIETINLPEINWTPAKLRIVTAFLTIPFILVLIWTFKSGSVLIGLILCGMAIFVGLMYLALRYIENNDF